jgi:hypothetical protein
MTHVNPKTPKARLAEKAEQSEAAQIKRAILSPGIPVLPGYRDCDQQPTSTYFSRTAPGEPAEGEGAMPMHHQLGKASKVVGRDGEVYPRVPADNPWHHNREDERPRKSKAPEAETDLVKLRREYARLELQQKLMGGIWSPAMDELEEAKARVGEQIRRLEA